MQRSRRRKLLAGAADLHGNCYQVCALVVVRNPKDPLVLVHGTASNPSDRAKRLGHAWVEIPPGVPLEFADQTLITQRWMCFDPTTLNQKCLMLPKYKYYEIGAIEVNKTFTADQIHATALFYGHWGPWDGTCAPKVAQ